MTPAVPGYRPESRYSPAQERVLHALAASDNPCTADDLTERGLMAPTVLTLGCLIREQLVSSQVVRRSESERAIPVYVLTDRGRDVVARLVASHVDCAATDTRGHRASPESTGDRTANMSCSVSTRTQP